MRHLLVALLFTALFAGLLTDCGQQPYRQGQILYENFCANCHMADGTGLAGNIPPLAGADYLRDQQDKIPCIIRYGLEVPIVVNGVTYENPMAGIPELNDVEIANVINYINQAWGNDFGYVPLDTVRAALKQCR
jgi:mono/diheme cytochrome c family protein